MMISLRGEQVEKQLQLSREQQIVVILSNPLLNDENNLLEILTHTLNWNFIYEQVLRHKIVSLAYYRLQHLVENVPSDFLNKLKLLYDKNKQKQCDYLNECFPIYNEFNNQGLKYCVLKGPILQELIYPPFTRMYNDFDILIQRTDYLFFKSILNKYDFFNENDNCNTKKERERLFLFLNTYEFPAFKKILCDDNKLYIDLQHDYTLSKQLNYNIDIAKEMNLSSSMIINSTTISYQNLLYLLIHLCTHEFGDSVTISEIISNKAFRLRNFGDIVGLVEKYINKFCNSDFYELVKDTKTVMPVYFCLYYCTQLYNVSKQFKTILEELDKVITDFSFLNQYGFENGTNGIHTWKCSFEDRLFSKKSVDEVNENSKEFIKRYSEYDTRIN